MLCQACSEGRHGDCGMQTWCECECDGEAIDYGFDMSNQADIKIVLRCGFCERLNAVSVFPLHHVNIWEMKERVCEYCGATIIYGVSLRYEIIETRQQTQTEPK